MWNGKLLGLASAIGFALLGSQSFGATFFGSALDHQPTPPEKCKANNVSELCSWVLVRGRSPGHERAPKAGTVVKLRLLSCTPGTFVLQIAHANPTQHKARVLRSGPLINYKGDARNCDGRENGFIIETFPINIAVQTGDLSVVATKVGFIYSSGDREDLFNPPLADGGVTRSTTNTGLGSGILLLQALYND
jgi:hypothetical protein